MTISLVYPSSWGVGEILTSAQMNAVQTFITYALDKRAAQTDTLESIISAGGSGRIVDTFAVGADANTTYLLSGANSIIDASAITAARTYRLGNTGAIQGDRLMLINPSAFDLTVQDDSPGTIAQLGPDVQGGADSTWADFIFNGTSWIVWRSSKNPVLSPQVFTANDTYVPPRGSGFGLLIGFGAGASGGGGSPGNGAVNANGSTGGGGGGGSQLSWQIVGWTPGTSYVMTIGTPGASAPATNGGSDGSSTTFDTLATFPGAGAGSSSSSSGNPNPCAAYGGAPVALNSAVTTGLYSDRAIFTYTPVVGDMVQLPPGSGGRSMNHVAPFSGVGAAGTPSTQGFAGGAGGAVGTTNTGVGGGGGGGGGGGPGGVGGAGGAGGNGNSGAPGLVGSAGAAAAANTGAGGGGGGGGGTSISGGGAGAASGTGGSGKLTVVPLR